MRLLAFLTLALLPLAVFAQNCQLIVPPRPLTASGLATPYQLQTSPGVVDGCMQNNLNNAAFVHGVILDTSTGAVSVYNPLVVTAGTAAAIQPTPPKLPANNVVALWFGFNGNILTLLNTPGTNSLADGNCVNGANTGNGLSQFVQYAYCNAPAFYQAAHNLILAGKLVVPPLGNAVDGKVCPNVRSWEAIDQDQSDNVPSIYLLDAATQSTAQMTAANVAALNNPTPIANPSDNLLITNFIMPAVGCAGSVWKVPDLADNGNPTTALPLNEIQANMFASTPQALVPLNHAFTTLTFMSNPAVITNLYPLKTNLYRAGVFQPPIQDLTGQPLTATATLTGQGNPKFYCSMYNAVGGPRLQTLKPQLLAAAAPGAPTMTLFDFLLNRFQVSNQVLNCTGFGVNMFPLQ